MKESEARKYLQRAMRAFQRYRSIFAETGWSGEEAQIVWPWVFGDKCPLPAIAQILDAPAVTPHDFYNMMTIINTFTPEVKAHGEMEAVMSGEKFTFPKPDIKWLKGWQEEDQA